MIRTFQCEHTNQVGQRTFTFELCDTEIRLISVVRRPRHGYTSDQIYHHDVDFGSVLPPVIPENVVRAAISFFRRQIKLIQPTELLSEALRDARSAD